MGTLFNQKERTRHDYNLKEIYWEIDHIMEIASKTGLTYDQVLSTMNMLELRRRNELYRDNGDVFDEQLAGFGELIQEFLLMYENVSQKACNDDGC